MTVFYYGPLVHLRSIGVTWGEIEYEEYILDFEYDLESCATFLKVTGPFPHVSKPDDGPAYTPRLFSIEKFDLIKQSRTKVCKSVKTGEACVKNGNCGFAHVYGELDPLRCTYGKNCRYAFATEKRCFYIHPPIETKDVYCVRLGIFHEHTRYLRMGIDDVRERVFKSPHKRETRRFEKTKFCKQLILSGECTRKECTFAHTLSEFNPECVFGLECKNKMACTFKHKDESIEEYCFRVDIPLEKISK